MLSDAMTWLVNSIEGMGYLGLLLLMAMESSVLPVPSELVMPPAGYLAARGEMNVFIALLCGTAGSMIGAYVNYLVAARLGRWVFVRYGKWVLLTEKSLEKTERFFARHGEIATFVGRLFPVIRHLISIPAGLARMPLGKFFAYTGAGAGIWCSILLAIGWIIGKAGENPDPAVLKAYSHRAILILLPVLVVIVVVYLVWDRRRKADEVSDRQGQGQGL